MTTEQIEEYKNTAKKGDRFQYTWKNYDSNPSHSVSEVVEVRERGVVLACFCPGMHWHGTHRYLQEWSEFFDDNWKIIHKEP